MKRVTITAQQKRTGAKHLRTQASPPLRTEHERRLRWLLGFTQETSVPRTPAERRTVHAEVGAYLGGLLLRQKGEDADGSRVMELGNSRALDELPMRGADNRKPLKEKLALIRTGVRRIVEAFLSAPKVSVQVTGEIVWQHILDKAPGRAPTFRERWVADDVREGITCCLLEDLAMAGALVRQCPATGCGKIFVRRYRQLFCSTACRNRTNFRIWYQGTRKKRKGTVMSPHATRRKRRPMYLRRARVRGKPQPRAKSA
jgi:hypothetical protein